MKIENVGLKFNKVLSPLKKVEKIIVHHPAHPTWDIHEIHKYHQEKLKWNGIGYNYFVTKDGKVQQGRGRNIGAHCAGMNMNPKSLGVSFQGDFDKQVPTEVQYRAGAELIAYLLCNEGLQINDVAGHNAFAATACPGKNFDMNKLKQYVLEEMNPNAKGSVQEVKKFEVSDATKNAIKNLSQYGIIAADFEVKDSNQAMIISMFNNMVKAIKDGKL
ncbi:peptidoglycan recognition protein family protein [Metabacillus fastidiosus]|uniref:peptidoglycan recognition protein family protein n=1 Tax=Metabacillus fastidiosus TaxID=1458 RepID=UPI003D2BAB6F